MSPPSWLTEEQKEAFEFDKQQILGLVERLKQYPYLTLPKDEPGARLWEEEYGITDEDIEAMRGMSEEEALRYLEGKMAHPKLVVPLKERTKWLEEEKGQP